MSNGAVLKRVIRTAPEPCKTFGDHWLHPIFYLDHLVLQGQIRELFKKMSTKMTDEEVKQNTFAQAMAVGSVQLALHVGDKADSPLVFPEFSDAYAEFTAHPEQLYEVYGKYATLFELSAEEKKILPTVETSVIT